MRDYNLVCKIIRDSKFSLVKAAKALRIVAKLINDSGISGREFMRRFVPKEKPPSKEGLKNARERFHRARLILDAARREGDFDPSIAWTPETDLEKGE